ncbi:MAG: hypothetical protein RLZZ127_2517 [Planctomycetota bacterium]|jgi:ABC-type uncharacterized transport system permease subunit
MHALAVALVAVAGVAWCLAGWWRWREIRAGAEGGRSAAALWAGVVALTCGVVASAADGGHRDLLYGALGLWSGMAALLFVVRFLARPSAWLLALPAGGVALLLAVAGLLGGTPDPGTGLGVLVGMHVAFQLAHLGAMVVAAGAAALWLMASGALKRAEAWALRLPSLPLLERITDRFLVAATALLTGGLATGGVAVGSSPGFSLLQPAVVCAVATMGLLMLGLGFRVARRMGRRGLCGIALLAAASTALGVAGLVAGTHG